MAGKREKTTNTCVLNPRGTDGEVAGPAGLRSHLVLSQGNAIFYKIIFITWSSTPGAFILRYLYRTAACGTLLEYQLVIFISAVRKYYTWLVRSGCTFVVKLRQNTSGDGHKRIQGMMDNDEIGLGICNRYQCDDSG